MLKAGSSATVLFEATNPPDHMDRSSLPMVTLRPSDLVSVDSIRVRKLSAFRNNGRQTATIKTSATTAPIAMRRNLDILLIELPHTIVQRGWLQRDCRRTRFKRMHH